MTRRGALAVVALLCGLAACEDEPTPDIPDPTPSSTSPSVSESVSPTTPTETPEALTPEETVRAWIDARNEALKSGDTSGVERLSAESCEACEFALEPIREVYGAGGHFETEGWTLSGLTIKRATDSSALLDSGLTYEAGQTVPAAGAAPVRYEREEHIVRFRLTKEDGQWLMRLIVYYS